MSLMSREWYLFPFFGDSLTYLLTDLNFLPPYQRLAFGEPYPIHQNSETSSVPSAGFQKKKKNKFVGLLPTEERMWKAKYIAEYLRYRGKNISHHSLAEAKIRLSSELKEVV